MTKKLKSSLILSLFFLFGLMAALCAGAFSPALTPAKADETTYTIKFFDSDGTTVLKTFTGSGDKILTAEEYDSIVPSAVEGKCFIKYWSWFVYENGLISPDMVCLNCKYSNIAAFLNRFKSEGFYPVFVEESLFCEYSFSLKEGIIDKAKTSAMNNGKLYGSLSTKSISFSKRSDERITQEDLDAAFAKQHYSYELKWCDSEDEGFTVFYSSADFVGKNMYALKNSEYSNDSSICVVYYSLFTTTFKNGSEVVKTYTNQEGSKITAAALKTDLAKEGYRILGLSETADSTTLTPLTDITVTADKTYYVRYQKIQTLSIIDGDKTETAEVPADTPLFIKNYVSADMFKREGYIFKGFALTEGGEVAYDLDTTQVTITADTTLYAVYVKALTVSFMADGKVACYATIETGKTLDLGGAGITSIMTKDGYTLKGYATAENGEIVYEANAVITPESDLTLYAVYEETKTPGDDSGNIGDKVNDVSNKISEWLKSKTGIALSSSGVIVLAVVLVLILFKRK